MERSLAIAADLCIFTNRNVTIMELPRSRRGRASRRPERLEPGTARPLLASAMASPPPDSQQEPLPWLEELPPRQIVAELDRYIVGQEAAKKAIAIAVRNRWRRGQAPDDIRDEITPSNIILIGPTGVGKTEIARRLARLAGAPFIKVEASRFTEVGYVGRDVESMVRELVDAGITLVRAEREDEVYGEAERRAEERLLDLLAAAAPAAGAGRVPADRAGAGLRGLARRRRDAGQRGRRSAASARARSSGPCSRRGSWRSARSKSR